MSSDLDRDEAASTLASSQGQVEHVARSVTRTCCPHIAHPRGYDWKTFAIWVSDADYVFIKQAALLAEVRQNVKFN